MTADPRQQDVRGDRASTSDGQAPAGDGSRRSEAASARRELKRTVYVLARGGLVGFVAWLFRSQITAAAARYVTGPVAAAVMAVSLVLLAAGNNLHIDLLSKLAGASLLLTPIAYLSGWIRRTKEAAWAFEHGRGTKAFAAEIAADERRYTEAVGSDDWLIFPPWRESGYDPQPPRFGRRER